MKMPESAGGKFKQIEKRVNYSLPLPIAIT